MKALTLTQPWATLVVRGIKTVETRSWHFGYSDNLPMPLAIHAAKGQDRDDWSDGRVLWRFRDPVEFAEPIPRRGALGVWNWLAPEYMGLDAAVAAQTAP